MLIQAYRRKDPVNVDLFGQTIEFVGNADGDMVAEVTDQDVIDRLLSIDEAYREHGAKPAKAASKPAKPKGKFVLVNGDETVDLSAMDDKAVRKFGKENGVPVNNFLKGDDLRQLVIATLAPEA